MDSQIEFLVNDIQRLSPFTQRSEIEQLVTEMSHHSGIGPAKIMTILHEDLQNGIPFRYTAVGKCRSASL